MVKQAERWFGEFQKGHAAWEIVINVLQDASCPLEAKHLCSLALRNKCMQDLEELPKENVLSLREAIVVLVLSCGQDLSAIRTQLCLALSGIAAHLPWAEWNNVGVVAWVEARFRGEPKPHSSICLVEVLCILAEESGSYKPSIHPGRRRQYKVELETASPKAFQVLTECTNESFIGEGSFLRSVLQAFTSWLNLGGPDKLKQSLAATTQLHEHPMVQLAIKCLESQDADIFNNAVDVICVLVHCTLGNTGQILPEASGMVQMVMSGALSLRSHLVKYIADSRAGCEAIEMEDMIKAIGRLLIEIAEEFIYYIAGGQGDSMTMLESVLDVVSHPDKEVYSMTFPFWYRLSKLLKVGTDPDTEQIVFQTIDPAHVLKYQGAFSRLAQSVQAHSLYAANFDELSRSDRGDFKRARFEIADALVDANSVVGAEVYLDLITAPLQEHYGACNAGKPFDWRIAEATYFALRCVARNIPLKNPAAFTKAHQLLIALPQLPRHPRLLRTSCQTIGACADMISAAMKGGIMADASLLSSLLTLVSSAMTDSVAASEAASAYRKLCDACGSHMLQFADQLLAFYNAAISGAGAGAGTGGAEGAGAQNGHGLALVEEDVLEIIEGTLCMVLSMPPSEKREQFLQMVLGPIVHPLQAAMQDAGKVDEGTLLRHLEQLAIVFKNIRDNNTATQLLNATAQTLDRALEVLGPNVEGAEKVCKALIHGLKASGSMVAPNLLQHLFTNIPQRFANYSHPCFLYLSSQLVKMFGAQPDAQGWLQVLVSGLVGETSTKLSMIAKFDDRPDIVDDLFLLAGRVLSYAPSLLFREAGMVTLQHLFSCGLKGMFIQHREACTSILIFFDCLLGKAAGSDFVQGILVPNGLKLTKNILAGTTGMLGKYFLDDLAACLEALLKCVSTEYAMGWLYQALSVIPTPVLSDQEKSEFVSALATRSQRDIRDAVETLSEVCRRNARVREETMKSLLAS